MSQSIYALIIDDHPLVGRGIAEFLKQHALLGNATTVATAQQARAHVLQHGAAAVALLDFWLADGATEKLIAELREEWPRTKIIVMSGDDDPAIEAKARAAKAQGFLHKQDAPQVFAQAVTAVLGGLSWFGQRTSGGQARAHARELPISPAELGITPRQGQVLQMILQGMPNKSIAQAMTLSEHTVKEHITAILQKLAVSNRVEAITKLRGRRLVLE